MQRTLVIILALWLLGGIVALGQSPSSVNQQALAKLQKRAAETHSDAVVIFKDNQLVAEWYFDKERGQIELMSCTKSIVNIALGRLIDTGKIKSLDQPVYEFYPEWRQGRKKLITIRHLLNHTSGLQNLPTTTEEIYPSPDFVKLALAAEVSDQPGSKFSYNNKAANLLAGIVQVASGKRMDSYFRDEIFQPMGITDFIWDLDPAGNPQAMSGLKLKAIDFAKFGQLILNKGVWHGARIVSEKWIEESLQQGQPHYPLCGLLWWRIPSSTRFLIDDEKLKELEAAGVERSFLDKLAPLKGREFADRPAYEKAVAEALGPNWREAVAKQKLAEKNVILSKRVYGEIVGYNANGYLGQYLVIYPWQKLVAVRQVKWSKAYDERTDGFEDFMDLVRSLDK